MSHRRRCCCEPIYAGVCVVAETASVDCDNENCTGSDWSVSQVVVKYTAEEYDTEVAAGNIHGWEQSDDPVTLCSGWHRAYAFHWLYDYNDDCPSPPTPGTPPATAPRCCVCIAGNVLIESITELWVNGSFCSTLNTSNLTTSITARNELCGNLSTDWIDLWFDPDHDYDAFLEYQPSTGKYRITGTLDANNGECIDTDSTAGDTDPATQELELYCEITVTLTGYVDCLGREATGGDTAVQKYWRTITTTAAETTCDNVVRHCYYTTRKTCTEIVPGVHIWVLDNFDTQCLLASEAPATLNTWTHISGTTYEIVVQGGECTNEIGCSGTPHADPTSGEVACP